MEDRDIVNLYWERNSNAIKETASKYGGYCKSIAKNILGNNEDAEECVNDTYLNTWNSIPPNRPNILSTYLGKITRKDYTSNFASALSAPLNVHLGDRCTIHGVLVEVYDEGILLKGDSGVGKSEAAIELLKRGHRLVADDAVDIKKVSNKTLVGSAPELIRYFMELRGIGIIDVRRIFGTGAVKPTEKIDLIINLRKWEDGKAYDRMGEEQNYEEILGLTVPSLEVPIRPG